MQITEELLDAAQERDLARLVEAGLYARHLLESGDTRLGLGAVVEDAQRAWARLWLANTGMVKVVARRYGRGRPEIEDELVQEGFLALAQALMRFDWSRDLRLSTLAWYWVKNHVVHVMRARSAWENSTSVMPDALDVSDGSEPAWPDGPIGVGGLLAPLSATERKVLLARAEGLRQCDVAHRLGVGTQVVRGIEKRALRRAREYHRLQQAA